MLITAWFTIASDWKQPKYPATGAWKNTLWSIHPLVYYKASKRKELLTHAMTLENTFSKTHWIVTLRCLISLYVNFTSWINELHRKEITTPIQKVGFCRTTGQVSSKITVIQYKRKGLCYIIKDLRDIATKCNVWSCMILLWVTNPLKTF